MSIQAVEVGDEEEVVVVVVEASGVEEETGRLAVGMPSSLEPRPKPEITGPDMRRG